VRLNVFVRVADAALQSRSRRVVRRRLVSVSASHRSGTGGRLAVVVVVQFISEYDRNSFVGAAQLVIALATLFLGAATRSTAADDAENDEEDEQHTDDDHGNDNDQQQSVDSGWNRFGLPHYICGSGRHGHL
jgi:hypothetical protein